MARLVRPGWCVPGATITHSPQSKSACTSPPPSASALVTLPCIHMLIQDQEGHAKADTVSPARMPAGKAGPPDGSVAAVRAILVLGGACDT